MPSKLNSMLLGWEKNMAVSAGCGLIYMPPTVLCFYTGPWAWVVIIASATLGLWLSSPLRRWIAVLSLLCAWYPDPMVTFGGWIGGFCLTCYLDGAYKRNPQAPSSEWD